MDGCHGDGDGDGGVWSHSPSPGSVEVGSAVEELPLAASTLLGQCHQPAAGRGREDSGDI